VKKLAQELIAKRFFRKKYSEISIDAINIEIDI
jgi:hypothetical protein